MKLSELKKLLKAQGAHFVRHGRSHDLWERNGKRTLVPRHDGKEIANGTVKAILSDLGI